MTDNPFLDNNFSGIFDELYSPLCQFCMRFVNEKEVAEDIVQEQFIYLWEHREKIKKTDSLKSYLHIAVKNRSINYLKRKFKTVNSEDTDLNLNEIRFSNLPDPQKLLETKELGKILERSFESLPERCRTIFIMKKVGELSNKEIAQKLNISVKTVEAQITIAFKKLTHFISNNWEFILILFINLPLATAIL